MFNWQKIGFYCLPPLLALTVFFGVNFKTDLSAFMMAGDKAESILLASEMQTGALSRRYLISVGSDLQGVPPKKFITALKTQLQAIEGVVEVWLPEENKQITQVISKVYSRYANTLYSLNPEQDLEVLFSEQGLNQRAVFLKSALLSSHGRMVKQIALQDPLLLTVNSFKGLNTQLNRLVKQQSQYQNLILETKMAGLAVPQQQQIQTAIQTVFEQLNQTQQTNYQLEMTGVAVFAVATQTLIQGDIQLVSVLSGVVLMILFLVIFRSFSHLFQVFSVLIIVILSSILMTQLIFG